ncbi:ribbon-helix-helix domain-containing protein [Rhizobium sp. 21-4511-3d]
MEKQWEDFVEKLVARGRYRSPEEVVTTGLSLVAQREARLKKLRDIIDASIATGGDVSDDELGAALAARIAGLKT